MKYHLPRYRLPAALDVELTLCGREARQGEFLWNGASDYVKDRYGCKSCLRIAGQKRQAHQRQEATE